MPLFSSLFKPPSEPIVCARFLDPFYCEIGGVFPTPRLQHVEQNRLFFCTCGGYFHLLSDTATLSLRSKQIKTQIQVSIAS